MWCKVWVYVGGMKGFFYYELKVILVYSFCGFKLKLN